MKIELNDDTSFAIFSICMAIVAIVAVIYAR